MSASAVAFDMGLQYRSDAGVDVGVGMRNYGTGIQFEGTSVEYDVTIPYANPNATPRKTKLDMASHELPASLLLGLAYRFTLGDDHAFNASAVFANNAYAIDNALVGLEYRWKKTVSVRGGYTATLFPSDYPEDSKEAQYGLTLGFGFRLPLNGRSVSFDYAYRDMDLFSANQCFGVSVGL
jgi:hypothetical protein